MIAYHLLFPQSTTEPTHTSKLQLTCIRANPWTVTLS